MIMTPYSCKAAALQQLLVANASQLDGIRLAYHHWAVASGTLITARALAGAGRRGRAHCAWQARPVAQAVVPSIPYMSWVPYVPVEGPRVSARSSCPRAWTRKHAHAWRQQCGPCTRDQKCEHGLHGLVALGGANSPCS